MQLKGPSSTLSAASKGVVLASKSEENTKIEDMTEPAEVGKERQKYADMQLRPHQEFAADNYLMPRGTTYHSQNGADEGEDQYPEYRNCLADISNKSGMCNSNDGCRAKSHMT
ncbi:hypothetical protein AgCh_024476 [Apium graveolens]